LRDEQDGLGTSSSHRSSLVNDLVAADSKKYQGATSTKPLDSNSLHTSLDREFWEVRGRAKSLDTAIGKDLDAKCRRVYGGRYENISYIREQKSGQLGEYAGSHLASKLTAQ
jgi:hypothetical protein